MTYNFNRMAQVMRFCRQHPESHDQKLWIGVDEVDHLDMATPRGETDFGPASRDDVVITTGEATANVISCGTTACFAGWTVLLNPGDRLLVRPSGDADDVLTADGQFCSVQARAADLLGLNENEADAVFCDTSTLEDVAEALESITGQRF